MSLKRLFGQVEVRSMFCG